MKEDLNEDKGRVKEKKIFLKVEGPDWYDIDTDRKKWGCVLIQLNKYSRKYLVQGKLSKGRHSLLILSITKANIKNKILTEFIRLEKAYHFPAECNYKGKNWKTIIWSHPHY